MLGVGIFLIVLGNNYLEIVFYFYLRFYDKGLVEVNLRGIDY